MSLYDGLIWFISHASVDQIDTCKIMQDYVESNHLLFSSLMNGIIPPKLIDMFFLKNLSIFWEPKKKKVFDSEGIYMNT